MSAPDYTDLVAGQRAYFLSGATRSVGTAQVAVADIARPLRGI